jgi:hypothetical protein
MSNTHTGGPAFPVNQQLPEGMANLTPETGMTLRDYFAAKAMQGLLAGTLKSSDTSLIARDCYAMADAMLKARQA